MGLEDQQLRWLVRHMGHTEKVHLQNYRATSGLNRKAGYSKDNVASGEEFIWDICWDSAW